MKKISIFLAALLLGWSAGAADEVTVTVTGNRVSLRAAPDLNSVLLDRAMSGDKLVLVDNSNRDWVGVLPPESVDLWVVGEYIEGGIVVPEKLNVRSGPSLSHSIVGVVTNGTRVTVRGELAEWARIAPVAGTKVWISRKYAPVVIVQQRSAAKPPQEPAVVIEAVSESKSPQEPAVVIEANATKEMESTLAMGQTESVKTVRRLAAKKVIIEDTEAGVSPNVMLPDPTKEQGVELVFSGVLLPTDGVFYKLDRPDQKKDMQSADGVFYQLVNTDGAAVCYVRGNTRQMKELDGRKLTITGPAYWAKGMNIPIIRPDQIQLHR
jgi:uncharacterized protein YgiM (DUF1202 family)